MLVGAGFSRNLEDRALDFMSHEVIEYREILPKDQGGSKASSYTNSHLCN